MQDIYRALRHGLSGWTFPDLDWIVEGNRKTVIYCGNFALRFRLRVYFHNFLCFTKYNSKTRQLFLDPLDTQIIIATSSPQAVTHVGAPGPLASRPRRTTGDNSRACSTIALAASQVSPRSP